MRYTALRSRISRNKDIKERLDAQAIDAQINGRISRVILYGMVSSSGDPSAFLYNHKLWSKPAGIAHPSGLPWGPTNMHSQQVFAFDYFLIAWHYANPVCLAYDPHDGRN